jgi:hypothetical protein
MSSRSSWDRNLCTVGRRACCAHGAYESGRRAARELLAARG